VCVSRVCVHVCLCISVCEKCITLFCVWAVCVVDARFQK
jgi:hypothetical protein